MIGVYTTTELPLAMARGYTVLKVYEIWHYRRQGGLFSKCINTFMAAKVANSGWPSECGTDSQKARYLESLRLNDNVHVELKDVQNNPKMRLLAKLMLRTQWGRLAIQDNKPKFEYVRITERFNRLLYSNIYDTQ